MQLFSPRPRCSFRLSSAWPYLCAVMAMLIVCLIAPAAAAEDGSGTMNSQPGGINCSSACEVDYSDKTSVTLPSVPISSSAFTGRNKACNGSAECVVTMDAAESAANFGVLSDPALVAYWQFDEGAGTSALDSSGYGNHGKVLGADWVAGKVGGALDFKGGTWPAEDRVVISDSSSLSLDTNRVTIAMWIYPTDLSHPYNTLVHKRERLETPVDWIISPRSADRSYYPTFGIDWNADDLVDPGERADAHILLTTNRWYYLTVTYDGSAMNFYVDGELLGTAPKQDGIIPNHHSEIWLGANRIFSDQAFYGLMDEVRIYNRALSHSEIQALMSAVTSTLSVTKTGTGSGTVTSVPAGIDCGANCSAAYYFDTSVTLTAAAATGSTFAGWAGACTGTGGCTVAMDGAKSVTATFALSSYPFTVILVGDGSGTVGSNPAGIDCGSDCSESFSHGTLVTLTPTPAQGSRFVGWAGACTGTGECVVAIDAAKSVTASFTLNTVHLPLILRGY